jgi:8-oxo-dGTP pyrophosphatase MutT (NUDIX family)
MKIGVPSAIVVILDANNQILLLKRPSADSWSPGLWALPGGKIEVGETARAAAIRETKEESDLIVVDLKNILIELDRCVTPYYTKKYTGEVKIDFEHTDWAWVARDNTKGYSLAPGVLKLYDWVLQNG